MHSVVWLAGYASLAGYARLAVLQYLSTVCGARHYAQLGRRAKRALKWVESLISEKNPYRNIVKTV